ncbi:hypothetical protein I350_06418 [Cryptococcus amylolentus CBS 6273]|uniref:Uncharacterized protein n=1 Tax=Cryptococcus amylolentus CBS 6273 TaxID=1296118 RepID=A0A1E3JL68_9TREE|nr:hypothetical protein I350_06418 [Cryptococcus amylolentus CBS 6273]
MPKSARSKPLLTTKPHDAPQQRSTKPFGLIWRAIARKVMLFTGQANVQPPPDTLPLTIYPLTVHPLTVHPLTVHPLTVHPLTVHPLTVHPLAVHPLTVLSWVAHDSCHDLFYYSADIIHEGNASSALLMHSASNIHITTLSPTERRL